MNRVTPAVRDLAARLIVCETHGNGADGTKLPVAFLVCDRLRPHLATLMGAAGFRALLGRAHALASVEVPWLRAVRVKADGSLEWLSEPETPPAPEVPAQDGVILIAHMISLLAAFIGESLTLRLLREVWPKLPLKNLDFGNGVIK